ncbi:MAG: hypothetical protein ACPKPY_05445 [Nitrososphaeraceae archaeon]
MVKGWTAISIKNTVYERLEQIYKRDNKKPQNQKFTPWFEDFLLTFTTYNEKLERYGPFLELSNIEGNEIEIIDRRGKDKRMITVYVSGENKKLYCYQDDSNNCTHIGFCFAVPKIYNALINRGFKPPK